MHLIISDNLAYDQMDLMNAEHLWQLNMEFQRSAFAEDKTELVDKLPPQEKKVHYVMAVYKKWKDQARIVLGKRESVKICEVWRGCLIVRFAFYIHIKIMFHVVSCLSKLHKSYNFVSISNA